MVGWGTHASVVIDAPPSVVWETIIDLDSTPGIIPMVKCVEWLSREQAVATKTSEESSPTSNKRRQFLQLGTKWKEIRHYGGKDWICMKTITNFEEHPSTFSYEIQMHVYFPQNTHFTNTSSLSVQPIIENANVMKSTIHEQSKTTTLPPSTTSSPIQPEPSKTILVGTFAVHSKSWRFRFQMWWKGKRIKQYHQWNFQQELNAYKVAIDNEMVKKKKEQKTS